MVHQTTRAAVATEIRVVDRFRVLGKLTIS